jgi:hypothetical protein
MTAAAPVTAHDVNWALRATRHIPVRSRLARHGILIGSREHLEDIDYQVWRDCFAGELRDYYYALELDEVLRDDGGPARGRVTASERAEQAGVSRSTEYRQRRAVGKVRGRTG